MAAVLASNRDERCPPPYFGHQVQKNLSDILQPLSTLVQSLTEFLCLINGWQMQREICTFVLRYYDIKYQSHILFQICHSHLPSCLVPPRGISENCFAKTSTLNNHQLQNIHCTLHCKATFQKPHSVYLKVSLNKTLVLVLNKIDLVEPELSAAWKAYLQVIVSSDFWIFGTAPGGSRVIWKKGSH